MTSARGCILGLSLACLAFPALAQQAAAPADSDEGLTFGASPEREIVFTAFLGAQVNPAYFGSDEFVLGPSFRASVARLHFAGFNYDARVEGADPLERTSGFGYGLSFRYVGPRDSGEYDEIDGLDDIDATLEVGAGVGYAWPNWEVSADARYGLGGSDGWVGEARLNYVVRPTDRLALRIGPRLFFGSENYVDTYFGITDSESERSGIAAYDPDPGLVSVGLEAVATYQIAERWWLEGGVKWQRFEAGAADSPIVQDGDDDYTVVRIGLRRAFSIRF